jgi:Secretion system C-terminal sorting domain
MKNIITTLLFILLSYNIYTQTIDQRLEVVQNSQTVGGSFSIVLQVKGTGLTAANTLGSATVDINYDNTKLTYVNATLWAFGSGLGYNRAATNNTTFIRVGITGGGVNENEDGTPAGFDIGNDYLTWVQLNFTISNASGTSNFSIKPVSNAIGLYENHSNNPKTGVINNITLSAPEIENQPLPVELTSFTAKQVGEKISLSWQTKTEVNNYGFEVERMIDGKGWKSIGFIEGNGNSNSTKNYSFTDKNIKLGNKFNYRLKQIDTDGKYKYSDVEEVEYKPTSFELYQNYPNPFNPTTTIGFALPQASDVVLKVFNTLGEEVATLINRSMEAGVHTYILNANGLSNGMYIYQLRTNNTTLTKKMVLMK